MKQFLAGRAARVKTSFREDRDFSLYVLAGVFIGAATGIYTTVFNNYLSDIFMLTAEARGVVEFPRELPGTLVVLVLGALAFLGDVRMAALAMVASALGLVGLGLFSPSFGVMLVWLMIYSMGLHMYLPLNPTIGMSLSQKESYGVRLGLYSAYALIATIIGYGVVWVGFRLLGLTYSGAFVIAGILFACAFFVFRMMKRTPPAARKVKLVFRKKYSLYYALSLVNGARKQIFLTFAPWVLIQVYGLDPPIFAILGVIIALVSIGTRTIVGRAIDERGERFVLSVEAVILIVICFGYTFSEDLLPRAIALAIVSACYILDSSMSVVEMARSTYVKKIAICPEDVTPTLSAGVSLDHVVAMTVPTLGGLLWAATGAHGYKYIFMADAVFATLNLLLSRRMKIE
ncbi:MFS transporter [Papillibacter cinnamivorans]|uniref:Major Facilitator Superfamily protein n=1 Tax=Papillibacter cinnamivorans DSM 12816 TaxID=1122930 RepID=A0A1W2CBI2_9FIRM|nr:MFS transporter [Papillibacter cinnamivorans]SMC82540.1 Major Facilitator Superfamily protein [Papillibacter cinnamivorans DSM 12816]